MSGKKNAKSFDLAFPINLKNYTNYGVCIDG
jgi:hypothetical protein